MLQRLQTDHDLSMRWRERLKQGTMCQARNTTVHKYHNSPRLGWTTSRQRPHKQSMQRAYSQVDDYDGIEGGGGGKLDCVELCPQGPQRITPCRSCWHTQVATRGCVKCVMVG